MRQVLSGETTLGMPRDYNGTLRLILDAHLDLAWNALSFDRDQLQPIDELRRREKHLSGKSRGNCTVSLPEMRRAGVAACLGTVLCRATPSAIYEGEAVGPSSWPHSRGDEILRDDLVVPLPSAKVSGTFENSARGFGRASVFDDDCDTGS